MTKKQEKHLTSIKKFFFRAVDAKYRRGAVEHAIAGPLYNKSTLWLVDNAIDECIDQFTYLTTLHSRLMSFGDKLESFGDKLELEHKEKNEREDTGKVKGPRRILKSKIQRKTTKT